MRRRCCRRWKNGRRSAPRLYGRRNLHLVSGEWRPGVRVRDWIFPVRARDLGVWKTWVWSGKFTSCGHWAVRSADRCGGISIAYFGGGGFAMATETERGYQALSPREKARLAGILSRLA